MVSIVGNKDGIKECIVGIKIIIQIKYLSQYVASAATMHLGGFIHLDLDG